MGHRDQREGQLVDVGIGPLQPAVARDHARQCVVGRHDDLLDDFLEHLRRIDHLAQVHAHHLGVESVAAISGPREVAEKRTEKHPHRLFKTQCRVVEAAEGFGHFGDRPHQHCAIQAFLVTEVVVDRGDVGAGSLADLARRGGRIALGREDPGCGGDQLLAREHAAIEGALGRRLWQTGRAGLSVRWEVEGKLGGSIHRAAQYSRSIKRLI